MKMCAIIILALFTAPVLRARAAEALLQEVKAALEKKLPDGWTVRVDGESQRIEIEKVGKVLQHPIPLPNAMGGQQEPPKREKFVVGLKAEEFVSNEDCKKWREENRRISEKLGKMHESMRSITHKFDSYIPSNDGEREQVRAYEELKARMRDLPEYFYQAKVSFRLDNWIFLGGGLEGATLLIADEGVRRQVRKELAEAFSIFGRYGEGEE